MTRVPMMCSGLTPRRQWWCVLWLGLCVWLGYVGGVRAETIELTLEERAFVQSHPVLRVANDHTYAPFDFFENGQPQGYSIELIRLLLRKLGMQAEFVDASDWSAALAQLRAGRIDVVTSVQYTDSDAQYLLFSAPYLRAREVLLTRSDDRSIRSALDLQGRVVAMPPGYDYLNVLREHGIKFTHLPVASMAEAVEAVALGRADATLEAELVLQHIITQRGYTDLQMVYRLFGEKYGNFYTSHFGVRKDLPQLQALLNKALAALTLQERTALYLKWFGHSLGVQQAMVDSRLTPAEQAFVRQRSSVSVCLPENRPPYIWRSDTKNGDGPVELQGLVWDYLQLLGSRVGLSFQPHLVSSPTAARQALQAGRCEVAVLSPGAFPELSWHWTEHFLNLPYVLATSSNELFVEDMRDVAQRRFALGHNDELWTDLRLFYPGIELQSVARASDGIASVRAGQVFAYIDTPVAIAFALQQDAVADVKVVGKTPFAFSLAFATSDNASPLLHGVLQKAVDSVTDGDRQNLMSRWLSLRSEEGIDYSRAWMVGGMALLVLALILWWNRALHQARQRAQQAVNELRQMQLELQETNRQLEQMATTDRLTGVNNRMRVEQLLEHELETAAAGGVSFAVVMLDVDHFKQVNDTWGHLVGDAVLVGIGMLLKTGVRATDAAGRWGGEEFLLLCRDTDLAGAMHLADTLRQRLQQHEWSTVPQHVTASFGVAAYRRGDSVETLVGRADAALYRAKHLGRDRVEAEAS